MSLPQPKTSPPSDGNSHDPGSGPSFETLARQQGVKPVKHLEELLGGWPEEESNDGFEEAVRQWREQDDRPLSLT